MYSPAKSFSSDGFDVKTLKPGYMTYTFDAVSLAHLIHHPLPLSTVVTHTIRQ